ncbi:MAG: SRPBCC family protein [Candidatus Acidiferrum sp.]
MAPELIQSTVVRKTLRVEVPAERAFQVFTERMGMWWPPSHHVGVTPFRDILIDKKQGGRWYEINVAGAECVWGTVLAYEPPKKVVLSWHLQPDWSFSADLAKASEVALEFIAEGPETTRVEFEHRHLDRHGLGWEKMREQVGADGGWPMILKLYVEAMNQG